MFIENSQLKENKCSYRIKFHYFDLSKFLTDSEAEFVVEESITECTCPVEEAPVEEQEDPAPIEDLDVPGPSGPQAPVVEAYAGLHATVSRGQKTKKKERNTVRKTLLSSSQ